MTGFSARWLPTLNNFYFSGCYFFLVFQIFTLILIYIAELIDRYIYGKPERWEWLFPKIKAVINIKPIKNKQQNYIYT